MEYKQDTQRTNLTKRYQNIISGRHFEIIGTKLCFKITSYIICHPINTFKKRLQKDILQWLL